MVSERGAFGAPAWSPNGRSWAIAFRRADELPDDEDAPLSIRVNRLGYKHWPLERYCRQRAIIEPIELWVDTPDGGRVQA